MITSEAKRNRERTIASSHIRTYYRIKGFFDPIINLYTHHQAIKYRVSSTQLIPISHQTVCEVYVKMQILISLQ